MGYNTLQLSTTLKALQHLVTVKTKVLTTTCGARSWAGVVGGYYHQRWSAVVRGIDDLVSKKAKVSDHFFRKNKEQMLQIGQAWSASTDTLDAVPVGNTVAITKRGTVLTDNSDALIVSS